MSQGGWSVSFPPKLYAFFFPCGMKEHQGHKTQLNFNTQGTLMTQKIYKIPILFIYESLKLDLCSQHKSSK